MTKRILVLALGSALMALSTLELRAAEVVGEGGEDGGVRDESALQLDALVVQAGIAYRDRADTTAPVLSYDLEYFQRFEPSTVGDMIKRVPSAVFVSDVLEFDAVQLRGLAPGYTQILVNGKKVPGAGDDRSFWVDRIPAELVDRIEILRSNSANRSGDAVAGAINIVLRDAWAFEGSYLRAGLMHYDDGEVQPTYGVVTSGEALGGRLLAGFNVQDRYNPKLKRSDRFNDPEERELVSFEDQSDTRDGQDYSANASYTAELGDAVRLAIDGFYVKTDREQVEVSREVEFDDGETLVADVPGLGEVDQANGGLGLELQFDMGGGRTTLDLDHARFEDDSVESEEEIVRIDGVWDGAEGERLAIDASDRENSLKLAHQRPLGTAQLELGLDYRDKKRDVVYSYFEFEAEAEDDPVVYEPDTVVGSRIEEERVDPYLMLSGRSGALEWEAGLRYETTDADIAATQDGEGLAVAKDYDVLLPSLHLKWNLGDDTRLGLSLARGLRRPDFSDIIPATLEGEFGDNDFRGNPQLDPETSDGIDLGIERRLGRHGIIGFNLFHRDVEDLIELVNSGEPSEDALDSYADDIEDYMDENGVDEDTARAAVPFDPDSFVYTPANVGDGRVYGAEFDLSTPLTAFGLEHTGVFLNYAWLKSEVDDFLGQRRFNNQARSVYNVGFIQDLPSIGAAFGASYRKQGDAFSRVLAEEVTTRYGGDLEAFFEKRFGERVSLRLSGTNLLDADKDEFFNKFDTEDDQVDRDFDEYEEESERAGPRYQLVLRYAF